MSFKKPKLYYNTPLNISNTIDLPSNLLQGRRQFRQYQTVQISNQTQQLSPRQSIELPLTKSLSPKHQKQQKQPKSQGVMLIQQKNKSRRSVLYKRLSDIKNQNQQLQKYSYSKLLSKMVVVDPTLKMFNTVQVQNGNIRAISQYSCLRGKLMNMDYDEEKQKQKQSLKRKDNNKNISGNGQYANRTTRIFKRYYVSNSQKMTPSFFQSTPEQKYIYINGKKTECKRIHNFYTSQNFRQSYDKAFGRTTKQSFYSTHKDRY